MKTKARRNKPATSPKASKRRVAPRTLRVPITNIHSGNDYTARILIGSRQVAANVILDTGSSTLAVVPSVYKASEDTDMGPSSLAQRVKYGTGEWLGPVIKTSLMLGDSAGEGASLKHAPIAITVSQSKGDLAGVDGILGLAYQSLNAAVDLRRHLTKQKVDRHLSLALRDRGLLHPLESFRKAGRLPGCVPRQRGALFHRVGLPGAGREQVRILHAAFLGAGG